MAKVELPAAPRFACIAAQRCGYASGDRFESSSEVRHGEGSRTERQGRQAVRGAAQEGHEQGARGRGSPTIPTHPARAARRRGGSGQSSKSAGAAPRPRRRPPGARAARPPPRRADVMGPVFFVAIVAVGVVLAARGRLLGLRAALALDSRRLPLPDALPPLLDEFGAWRSGPRATCSCPSCAGPRTACRPSRWTVILRHDVPPLNFRSGHRWRYPERCAAMHANLGAAGSSTLGHPAVLAGRAGRRHRHRRRTAAHPGRAGRRPAGRPRYRRGRRKAVRRDRDRRPLDAVALNAGMGAGGEFARETNLQDELG